MQLLMAVGAVHIARPTVDYHNYLSHEADTHSEGVPAFFTTAVHYVCEWIRACLGTFGRLMNYMQLQ